MKGIIIAAGSGTRLYPLTKTINKQLLAIYDKPMIFYPLATLMLAGIRDILLITAPKDLPGFQQLLMDGSAYGVHISYAVQPSPDGIAQTLLIGEAFIGEDACALALGDNIFYGNGISSRLRDAVENAEKNRRATVIGCYVNDPKRFGVVEFDDQGQAVSIEEKPENPRSNYAVTGLYFYPAGVSQLAAEVKPSARGELEITTLNAMYLSEGLLDVCVLGRGFAWMDTGTVDAMTEATNFVQMIQKQRGVRISAPEEIAFRRGWLSQAELLDSAESYGKSPYGAYLRRVAGSEESS